jgi:AraC-like DNA-binding protein
MLTMGKRNFFSPVESANRGATAGGTVDRGHQALVAHQLGAAISDWAPLMDTADIDEATALLRPAFFPVDIAPSGRNPLHIRIMAERLPLLSVGYLELGGEAVLRAAGIPGYHVTIAVSGHTVTKWGDRHASTVTAPGAATLFKPGADGELTCSQDCAQFGVKIAPSAMHHELESLLNRPVHAPVEFARRLDLTDAATLDWLTLVGVLGRQAGRVNGLLRHRLAVANLQQLLIEGLLLTQPHNYTDELSDDGMPASQAVVKRAIDLMRCYPESAWTTAELARATGVSSRALQKAFARSGEPPPMTYLRQLRLHRVRCELADASRTGSQAAVTTAAGRWGFVHLGRFAQQYRQLFGESPSQTVRNSDNER